MCFSGTVSGAKQRKLQSLSHPHKNASCEQNELIAAKNVQKTPSQSEKNAVCERAFLSSSSAHSHFKAN